MSDLQTDLQLSLGSSYTLERELGGGGMSRVFVASEAALGRRVVVKVLAPELAEGISLERFEREIRMMASLQQANIVPLLSAGRTASLPYYTMPWVEGHSLRHVLQQQSPLSIAYGVNILRDVARALVYAHAHGIVHRDIKPDNILLSGDTAVVADFGIAKALNEARITVGDKLTQTGLGVGTPAYVAPEQAVGDPNVDHRADIYAFGCVAYEILIGSAPFHNRPLHLVVAAHIQEIPPSVASLRSGVPDALCTLVTKCLQKDPADRPQSARELLQALDNASSGPIVVERPKNSVRNIVIGGIAAAAIATFAILDWRSRAATNGAPSAGGLPAEVASLAVIPFVNVGGDSAQEYLADGMGDELATAVGKFPSIRIIGRSAAFQYRGRRDIDARAVTRALDAKFLLQGTLRQNANTLTVSTQLTDSLGGELWSDTFQRKPEELSAVRDSIVRAVSAKLRSNVSKGTASASVDRTADSTNAAALDLYLRGAYLLQRRGPGVLQSVQNFELAISKDENFARAYAGLSDALVLVPFFDGTPASDVYSRATNAAHRALALDSSLAEAHSALAIAYWNASQPDSAELEFKHAIAVEKKNFLAHFHYGRFLLVAGRVDDALKELELARQIDPISPLSAGWTAYGIFLNGDLNRAISEIERASQIDSTILPTVNFGPLLYLAANQKAEALRFTKRIPLGISMSNQAYVYAANGDTATAMRIWRGLDSRQPRPWFTDVLEASIMLAVSDTSRALSALEHSQAKSGNLWTLFIPLMDPTYDKVRHTPRFAALVRASKWNVDQFTSPRGGRVASKQ
ncbi:MAG: protein kinase [Gemmatimonadaceae bacterium]